LERWWKAGPLRRGKSKKKRNIAKSKTKPSIKSHGDEEKTGLQEYQKETRKKKGEETRKTRRTRRETSVGEIKRMEVSRSQGGKKKKKPDIIKRARSPWGKLGENMKVRRKKKVICRQKKNIKALSR